jgi:hypothetical protein
LPVEPGVFEVFQECGNCGKFTVVHQGNGCVSLSYQSSWNEGKCHPMWNVYNQEGWHNALNRSVKKCHPNIYELITTLKAEESATDRTTRSARLGAQPPPMWRKTKSRQQKIQIADSSAFNVVISSYIFGWHFLTDLLSALCQPSWL